MFKRKIKDRCAGLLFRTGFTEWYLRKRSESGALVLAYHRINTKKYITENDVMPGMYTSTESLEMQLRWLSNHYNLVSLAKIIKNIRENREWEGTLCAITFDDGWFDNYQFAFPILRKYNIPATIFIVGNMVGLSKPDCFHICYEVIKHCEELPRRLTGIKKLDNIISAPGHNMYAKARKLINEVRKLDKLQFDALYARLKEYYHNALDWQTIDGDYKMLSWKELKEMNKYGIDIGYHSRAHYMLTNIPDEDLMTELEIPQKHASSHGVNLINIFSYPDGQLNNTVIDTLKALGYTGATALSPGFNHINTDPYIIRRINVHEGSSSTLSGFVTLLAKT